MAIAPFPGIRATGLDTDAIGQTVPNVLKMFAAGRNFAQEDHQNALRFAVGGRMAEGDVAGATQAAFRGGDVKMGKDISNWSSDRQMRAVAAIREGAERADTPAKWAQVVRSVESAFGPETVANYRDFNSRPMAMTVLQDAELKLREKQVAQQAQAQAQQRLLQAEQLKLLRAQQEQARAMTPEARVELMKKHNIDPNSERGRAFALTGQYSPPSATDALLQSMIPGGQPQPGAAPQSPIRPQSLEGSSDPNLIPTQTAAPQPTAPAEPTIETPMGPMTEQQARRFAFGLGIAGKGDAGKMLMEETNRQKLGKEASNENDKRELAAVESLSRLRVIAQGFRPEFLTVDERLRQYGLSWADSIGALRKRLTPEQIKDHADYTMFVRDAVANLTEGIKNATGAAMGIQEEARIRKGLPDPEKDGPTAFASKLRGSVRELELLVARTRWLRRNGFRDRPWMGTGEEADKALPIGEFRRMLDEDGNRLQQQYRASNPDASDREIAGRVKMDLRQKYGIGI